MTDTRRAEFVEALNKAMGEAWRRGATNCDPRHESLASAHVLALYDEAHEGWHLANGVADLAMKHRDEAENALAATAVQGGEPAKVDEFQNLHRKQVDDSEYLHIPGDLLAAAEKLDEARSGGDEVAIQCVEQLRRHAEAIKFVHDEMCDACCELQDLNEHDLERWIEALRGDA